MKKLLIILLCLSSVAIAQEKKIRIELTPLQLETIARGLQASDGITAKEANLLIAELGKQYKAQIDTIKKK